MPPFRPGESPLAGIPNTILRKNLVELQTVLMEFAAGGRVVKASYTQGDGVKTVEFQQTNIAQIQGMIKLIQMQLGLIHRARRPINFVYR